MTATTPTTPRCGKCKAGLPANVFDTGAWTACPNCWTLMRAWAFPAMLRPPPPAPTLELVVDGAEAGCFNHPAQRAETVCDACGRFLCRLCTIDFAGRHLCSGCIETGHRKGKIRNLQNERTRHDIAAFSLALVPMLLIFPTIVTAPIALVYSIWGWRQPQSLVRPSRARFVWAIILCILQIAAWTLFFVLARIGGRTHP